MRLSAGQPAPDFEVVDVAGARWNLGSFRGRPLLLSFYRYASCPLCNLRVHQLIERGGQLEEKGLRILAFFQSPADSIGRYVGRQEAPFPIVADPKLEVYRRYGVEASWWDFLKGMGQFGAFVRAVRLGLMRVKPEGDPSRIPADFLIDEDGVIRRAYYGRHIGDHLPLGDILAWQVPEVAARTPKSQLV